MYTDTSNHTIVGAAAQEHVAGGLSGEASAALFGDAWLSVCSRCRRPQAGLTLWPQRICLGIVGRSRRAGLSSTVGLPGLAS
jgi:hypothetical protein